MICAWVKSIAAKGRKKRRAIDTQIFWPACKRKAQSIASARAAFAYHAMNDNAWTRDMSENEIIAFVKELDA